MRRGNLAPVAAHIVDSLIVGENQHDIRPFRGGQKGGERQRDKKGQKKSHVAVSTMKNPCGKIASTSSSALQ